MPEYRSNFNIPFDVDESILIDLKKDLEANGIPSISKVGVGLTLMRSLPYVNGNGMCMTAKCIKNSLNSGRFSQFNFLHERGIAVGTMIGLKVYDDTEELIPKIPMRVFGLGALYRDRLEDLNILPNELPQWGTSVEVLFKDFDFWHKGKIVLKEEAPSEWLTYVNEIADGIPYMWENSRVCIIAGGVDDDAVVEFVGNALTMNPADKEAGILLAVAARRFPIFDLEMKNEQKGDDLMPFKTFETEADWNAIVASIKKEYKKELKFDEVMEELQTVKASLQEKDNQLSEALERAEKAEGELQKQAIAALVAERKQILASKNYPEDRIAKKEDWLAKASQEEFNAFIEEIEALREIMKQEITAKASMKNANESLSDIVISLTAKKDDVKDDKKALPF